MHSKPTGCSCLFELLFANLWNNLPHMYGFCKIKGDWLETWDFCGWLHKGQGIQQKGFFSYSGYPPAKEELLSRCTNQECRWWTSWVESHRRNVILCSDSNARRAPQLPSGTQGYSYDGGRSLWWTADEYLNAERKPGAMSRGFARYAMSSLHSRLNSNQLHQQLLSLGRLNGPRNLGISSIKLKSTIWCLTTSVRQPRTFQTSTRRIPLMLSSICWCLVLPMTTS